MSKIRIFSRTRANSFVEWDQQDIWDAVADVEPVEIDISLILKDVPKIFDGYKNSIRDQERVKNANLDYPIIAARSGDIITVLDGFHRIYRAREARQQTIKAKILTVAPKPVVVRGRPVIPGLIVDYSVTK